MVLGTLSMWALLFAILVLKHVNLVLYSILSWYKSQPLKFVFFSFSFLRHGLTMCPGLACR